MDNIGKQRPYGATANAVSLHYRPPHPRRRRVGGCVGLITPDFSYIVFAYFAFWRKLRVVHRIFRKIEKSRVLVLKCEARNGKLRFLIPLLIIIAR